MISSGISGGKALSMAVTLSLAFAMGAAAAETKPAYSPNVGAAYPTSVYWGDTHLHTNLSSLDASDSGRFNLGPEQAYKFARGEVVEDNAGVPVRLSRPLDFLVIADHAEFMGLWEAVKSADETLMSTDWGRRWREQYLAARNYDDYAALDAEMLEPSIPIGKRSSAPLTDKKFIGSVWRRMGAIADAYNEPGRFTALIGFEWSATPKFSNLHRVVIFRDAAEKTGEITPLSATETQDPEDLWRYLERYEELTGGEALAVPHNANLSGGQMFAEAKKDGSPMDAPYAEQRARWEPLYEVTQMKGDSEAHPVLSKNDEFADYETWNGWFGRRPPPQWTDGLVKLKKGEYARPALKRGLELQAAVGLNPYKFGMIGSTDAHSSLAAAEEDNFWGKFHNNSPKPSRMLEPAVSTYKHKSPWITAELAASGYAAVWATENTREALFDAMKRREAYATTGPRMTLRFFGGWDYEEGDAFRPDLARTGYRKGVPMGGDLTAAPAARAPRFLIRAVKDPIGANLDRVQVIKGWLDADGESHEMVYDVAVSDARKIKNNRAVKLAGSTVDLATASYDNTIGDPELAVVWTDPDFDAASPAFYYVRVLEIPTPRWTAYDAARFSLDDVPEDIPMEMQERAYSSPIWYTPDGMR